METTQYDIAFFVSVGHGRSSLKIISCSKIWCPETPVQKYGVPKSCSKILCPETPVKNTVSRNSC
jgi:hypothetical protein